MASRQLKPLPKALFAVPLVLILAFAYYIYHEISAPVKVHVSEENSVTFFADNQNYTSTDNTSLFISNNKVYFKYSCSYKGGYAELPLDAKTLHVYNEYYFGDATMIWNSWFAGCNLPTKVEIEPSVDVATFAVFPQIGLAKDTYGLIGTHQVPQKGAYEDMVEASVRVPGFTDGDIEYIYQDIFRYHSQIYYLESDPFKLTYIPELPATIGTIYKSYEWPIINNTFLYILGVDKVFVLYPYGLNGTEHGGTYLVKTLEDADPKTFRSLSVPNYWTDAHHVYWSNAIVEGATSTDIQKIGESYVSSNGHIYWGSSNITDATFYQFRILPGQLTYDKGACGGPDYWTDGTNVFYDGHNLGADARTFTITSYPGIRCTAVGYAWDGNKFFFNGEQIPDVDKNSFKVIKDDYARDAHRVWDDGKGMPGDPNQLEKDIISGKIHHTYDMDGY